MLMTRARAELQTRLEEATLTESLDCFKRMAGVFECPAESVCVCDCVFVNSHLVRWHQNSSWW